MDDNGASRSRVWALSHRFSRWVKIAVTVAVLGVVTSYAAAPVGAALNPVSGALVSGALNTGAATSGISPTLPRGLVWLTDSSAAGGHWWIGDQLNGLCRLDPAAANPNNGPFVLGACNATAKS